MKKVGMGEFINGLKGGDIGIILAKNFFAVLQNWQRKKFHVPDRASHAFVMLGPPFIAEANGLYISAPDAKHPTKPSIIKYIDGTTQVWIYRNKKATPELFAKALAYVHGATETGGHYGIQGILQFGLQFIGIQKKLVDTKGQFCSEFAVQMLEEMSLPIPKERKAHEITPSWLKWWFRSKGPDQGYELYGHYDGKGNYYAEV
jgi:hypothetical protein